MTDRDYGNVIRFARLFKGRADAYGTGKGQWIKRPLGPEQYAAHLDGNGPGLGVAPLTDDGMVRFAAIDLDEPDFEAAREMQEYIPGDSFIERSRSGNAHVWVFFSAPIEAWVVRGILKEAILAADKGAVEIFPKQDKLKPGMFGNYINLPFHGDQRPILRDPGDVEPFEDSWHPDEQEARERDAKQMRLEEFLDAAESSLNDPAKWHQRARFLLIVAPEQRESRAHFGEQKELHMCAEWIIGNRDENPIGEGHRNEVYFAVARQLTNYEGFDHDEALQLLLMLNDAALPPAPRADVVRILNNAEKGEYTSTGCDNPLVAPYCHPDCPIAHRSPS
jgi:hypothetical protein